ncbi:MAG: GHKL domain-containing protein [Nitrospiraceae bacterium]|nr:MAG: GHKL domain-containing protein [Nitrospiraceae bacterium]
MQIPIALTKTFNAALNELGSDMALIALREDGFGPYLPQSNRGFSPREVQAVVKALSVPEVGFDGAAGSGDARPKAVRIRMTAPAHRSLLGVPLKLSRRVCGALVVGRKDIVSFSEKDRRHLAEAAGEIEAALASAGIPTMASLAPVPAPSAPSGAPVSETGDAGIELLLAHIRSLIPYDRVLLTRYDPQAKVLTTLLSHMPGRCEWREGQTLTLDGSAAGWMIRHKKPRMDRDLASTQGRFLDYKELYKDKFKTALGLPLRRGQDFIGTIVLGSKTPDVYNADMARAAAPQLDQLAAMLPTLGPRQGGAAPSEATGAPSVGEGAGIMPSHDADDDRELMIRQVRQGAIREVTTFLEQEIQRPLTKTRMAMEEAMQESPAGGILQRVEKASLELTRIEAILNEVLDFAKPLDLHPRVVRIPEVLESALAVITDDLEKNAMTVTRQFSDILPPIKADEGKLQQVFLSILKNALEAMTPHGHILLQAVPHKGARGRHEVAITIQNDGAPIPTEHIGKIFEPGFTTKAAGTGLGLASVKKIIEEHRGQISIASGPDQGTAVIIRLPAHAAARHQGGRGRRRPRPG